VAAPHRRPQVIDSAPVHDAAAPALLALVVFVAGYGALTSFWWLGTWGSGLPGLYDYRSATLGDGVLLPALAAALLVVGRSARHPVAHERAWSIAVGLAGAIFGALSQVLWLEDPSPHLNWTLPDAHHFNVAGWWHAAFLTSASGLFAALWVWALRRIHAGLESSSPESGQATRRLLRSPAFGLATAATLSMVGLVFLDSVKAAGTEAGTTSLAAIGVALTALVVVLVLAAGSRSLWHMYLLAVSLSLGTVLSALRWPPGWLELTGLGLLWTVGLVVVVRRASAPV
jgi:hypothetical protein